MLISQEGGLTEYNVTFCTSTPQGSEFALVTPCQSQRRLHVAHPALEKNSVGSALAEVVEAPVAVSVSRVLTGSKRARPDMSPDEAGSRSASSKMGSVDMMDERSFDLRRQNHHALIC